MRCRDRFEPPVGAICTGVGLGDYARVATPGGDDLPLEGHTHNLCASWMRIRNTHEVGNAHGECASVMRMESAHEMNTWCEHLH